MHRALGSCHLTGLTAAAGTAITGLIPPRRAAFTRLTRVQYRCGSTAHTLTFLKAFGKTVLAAGVAQSGTSITLAADPGAGTPSGNLANGDWVCVELDGGGFFLSPVSSLTGLTMTVNALPAAAKAGNRVWTFGVPGDHPATSQTTLKPNPERGSALTCTASALNDWSDVASGMCQSLEQDSPLMVHSNNATAAGTFEMAAASYTLN